MKLQHLKKKGKNYICPNCGSILHYENNQEAGEAATDYWHECYSCGLTVTN